MSKYYEIDRLPAFFPHIITENYNSISRQLGHIFFVQISNMIASYIIEYNVNNICGICNEKLDERKYTNFVMKYKNIWHHSKCLINIFKQEFELNEMSEFQ